MFKRIIIELTEPICKCKNQSLGWSIYFVNEVPCLKLTCKLCNVELRVPNKVFLADYKLDKPYPTDIIETPELIEAMKEVNKLLEGCRIESNN